MINERLKIAAVASLCAALTMAQGCGRAKRKFKVSEIPGDEPKRIGGKRKMHPLYNGLSVLYQIIKELFFRYQGHVG